MKIVFLVLIFVSMTFCHYFPEQEITRLREMAKSMFYHGYNGYIENAFPLDELRPMSCSGFNTMGDYALTLIDTLDSLVVFENYTEFEKRMWWIADNVDFDKDINVSVFETNIRVLGGLLSAHMLITFTDLPLITGERKYNNELLDMALDIGKRLLPAFNTNTGIPYGTVNLKNGVPVNETPVTCTAGGGTFTLEFGILSRLTNNPEFEIAARRAVRGLWKHRSDLNLLGNHIDTSNGKWIHRGAGIGAGADSFYEYLLKSAIFFDDLEYLEMWNISYDALRKYTKIHNWYVEADYEKATVTLAAYGSLQSFWPGLQALYGDLEEAVPTLIEFYSVWRRYGFTPEFYDLTSNKIMLGSSEYPLRPELAESILLTFFSLKDHVFYQMGRDLLENINNYTKVECGFAAIDVSTHTLRDHMDSFFLAETIKYLYLLFSSDNYFHKNQNYIFNTEAHIFIMDKIFKSNYAYQSTIKDLGKEICVPYNYGDSFSVAQKIIKDECTKNPHLCNKYIHKEDIENTDENIEVQDEITYTHIEDENTITHTQIEKTMTQTLVEENNYYDETANAQSDNQKSGTIENNKEKRKFKLDLDAPEFPNLPKVFDLNSLDIDPNLDTFGMVKEFNSQIEDILRNFDLQEPNNANNKRNVQNIRTQTNYQDMLKKPYNQKMNQQQDPYQRANQQDPFQRANQQDPYQRVNQQDPFQRVNQQDHYQRVNQQDPYQRVNQQDQYQKANQQDPYQRVNQQGLHQRVNQQDHRIKNHPDLNQQDAPGTPEDFSYTVEEKLSKLLEEHTKQNNIQKKKGNQVNDYQKLVEKIEKKHKIIKSQLKEIFDNIMEIDEDLKTLKSPNNKK